MKLTRTEFQRLKVGERVLFEQGKENLHLKAIVVVDDNFRDFVRATIDQVLHKGDSYGAIVVRTYKILATVGHIYRLGPISKKERLSHIFYVLKEMILRKNNSFFTTRKKSKKL